MSTIVIILSLLRGNYLILFIIWYLSACRVTIWSRCGSLASNQLWKLRSNKYFKIVNGYLCLLENKCYNKTKWQICQFRQIIDLITLSTSSLLYLLICNNILNIWFIWFIDYQLNDRAGCTFPQTMRCTSDRGRSRHGKRFRTAWLSRRRWFLESLPSLSK